MKAMLIQIPVVHRPSFHDPAWREQFDRECEALGKMQQKPPPRTRPLIVAYRQEGNVSALLHQNELRLLADRLRWLFQQRCLTLDMHKELGNSLQKIVHHLDELVELRAREQLNTIDQPEGER
jgi:hypothetical protein